MCEGTAVEALRRRFPGVVDPEKRDPFDLLEVQYMSVMSRLEVLRDAFGLDKVPNELAPAAYVLRDTVDDAVKLYDDLQSWHFAHEHTPKAKEVQS